MKLSLDELLTDADVSAICVAEDHPLSLDRIMHRTISKANGQAPARKRKRLSLPLIAAVTAALLATTVFAMNTSGYRLHTVNIEYEIDENGRIIRQEAPTEPESGISLSVSDISPTGLNLICFPDDASDPEGCIITGDYFLDIQTENGWEVVPAQNAAQLQAVRQNVSGESCTVHIDWSATHGELSPGTYRIRPGFEFAKSDNTFEVCFIGAEFIIEG